jgi:hypothetical protein
MASRRKQQHLPGIEPGDEPIEIVIPTMGWKQIGGDMDPGTYGGTIAFGDGNAIQLINIQPVREYVGDKEAADVGFPFWTKEAYFDLRDLDPSRDEVRSALDTVGLDRDALEEMDPEQRAIAIAQALADYGRRDEGPAGWSADIGIPDGVEWWGGKIEGSEYLADEDEAFRDDILGYGDIKTALEETIERMADQDGAAAWSTVGDQLTDDIADAGFDPESIVIEAQFGDAEAVNGDLLVSPHWAHIFDVPANELWSEVGTDKLDAWLEANGYEYLSKFGGRVPSSESEVSGEHAIRAVAKELDRDEEDVEKAAESLDWWQEEIPRSTAGSTYVWAKPKAAGIEESRRTRHVARASGREATAGFAVGVYDQRLVEENAHERFNEDPEFKKKAIKEGLLEIRSGDITQAGWQQLNTDIRQIESNALTWLHEKFVNARSEGHDDNDLVGSFWFDPTNPDQAYLVDLAADSGRQERIDMQDASFGDLSDTVWEGVSDFGAAVLGGGITFFDVKPEDMEVVEQTLERERKRRK